MATQHAAVEIREEEVAIPTYGTGAPNRNPMFLEKRVYQGSSGVVYPHPVVDKILDEREERTHRVVFMENEWIRVMVMPSLGGRVQMAINKTNGHRFVYHNQVIKPALVGLAGPWISGGIEFNWPQHHRPSTFEPIDHRIEEHEDGSKTLWVGEIERMFRTKGMAGFTLRPGRAVLEIRVQLSNRTPLPQTFLWWANPAVHVHDHYRTIFPPDVTAVYDHGKRDVSAFPIARGTYYKVDYSAGVDISKYKNIPVPTSFMANKSEYDFLGGYEDDIDAGMIHYADHHVSPGKKQWVWGCGDFGTAWDRELTDEDGPYAELMAGVYTDNQPDFTWIMPFEEKSFTQCFLPVRGIGGIKNANADAALNIEPCGKEFDAGVYCSSPREVEIVVEAEGRELLRESASVAPDRPWRKRFARNGASYESIEMALRDAATGEAILSFAPPQGLDEEPMPDPAKPAPDPQDAESIEELFLVGQHLEQYRHATYDPASYYEEALRRDPRDIRCNNAMGLLKLRRGLAEEALPFFERAVARQTGRNPNPRDGEPRCNLGLALLQLGRLKEAYDAFAKAAWNAAMRDTAHFHMALIDARRGRFDKALEHLGECLDRNARHYRARHLRVALLRRMGRTGESIDEARRARALDALDAGSLFELALHGVAGSREEFQRQMRGNPHSHIELALDYAHAGLHDEAIEALSPVTTGPAPDARRDYPESWHALGWILGLAGRNAESKDAFAKAASLDPGTCFHHNVESIAMLESARRADPADARAPYYLGNYWYSRREHERAIACWEEARRLDPEHATTRRNLALAYANKRRDPAAARRELEAAFAADASDARVLFELDQLRKLQGDPAEERLALLDDHPGLVAERDDLSIERINLLNHLGRFDDAITALESRRFHPWEGGEGKTTDAWARAHFHLAAKAFRAGGNESCIAHCDAAASYPPNLGEGKLAGATENHLHRLRGLALRALGREAEAAEALERATLGETVPSSARYYNDQPPELILHNALARRALGRDAEFRALLDALCGHADAHFDDEPRIDYFAVSLPDFLVFDVDLAAQNRAHCWFLRALAAAGCGDADAARAALDEARSLEPFHAGAEDLRRLLDKTPEVLDA